MAMCFGMHLGQVKVAVLRAGAVARTVSYVARPRLGCLASSDGCV